MNDTTIIVINEGTNDLLTKLGGDYDGDACFPTRFKYSKKPNKTKQNRNIKARKYKLSLYKQIEYKTKLKTESWRWYHDRIETFYSSFNRPDGIINEVYPTLSSFKIDLQKVREADRKRRLGKT
jgi:hypothetical protein